MRLSTRSSQLGYSRTLHISLDWFELRHIGFFSTLRHGPGLLSFWNHLLAFIFTLGSLLNNMSCNSGFRPRPRQHTRNIHWQRARVDALTPYSLLCSRAFLVRLHASVWISSLTDRRLIPVHQCVTARRRMFRVVMVSRPFLDLATHLLVAVVHI
ncbi:hypothetical protein PLICRDRAFT_610373 [Plicaturopsis crispa FD-325 SS-3]|nr:hypothetical protein PLICRDRAFT_610373 [Plicaturopsis crispa FD-325 SS-3]